MSVTKILFSTTHSYMPFFYGGSELSTNDLIKELSRRQICAAVNAHHGSRQIGVYLNRLRAKLNLGRPFAATRYDGYPVYRSWNPVKVLPHVTDHLKPDIGIVQSGGQGELIRAHVEAGLPVVVYVRDAMLEWASAGDALASPLVRFVANSAFTAAKVEEASGRHADVIPPLVQPERCRVAAPGQCVLMVNPHPFKGVDVALRLAEMCPDIQFLFVGGWGNSAAEEAALTPRFKALPNVRRLPATDDMRGVYAQARVLLAPSGTDYLGKPVDWVEAWGRVVTEAQHSGIPAIATADGGLPESVGTGGLLVARDAPIDAWYQALRRVWDDPAEYERLSAAALDHASRHEIQPATLCETFVGICNDHVAAARNG